MALLFYNIWPVSGRTDNRQGMTRISYPYHPVPLTLVAMVALLVTLAVPKLLVAQLEQSPTADTVISSEIPPPDSKPKSVQPVPAPDKSDMAAATDVEIRDRLDRFEDKLPDRDLKLVDSWLTVASIFVTLLGIVATIFGGFTFQKSRRPEPGAPQNVVVVVMVKQTAMFLMFLGISTSIFGPFSLQRFRNLETEPRQIEFHSFVVREDPAPLMSVQQYSLIDQAVDAAISLQQQGKAEEAIEKWRSIANVAEGADSQLQARAWLSVGSLHDEGDNWEAAIDAYDEAIRLKPNSAEAYNNRGFTKRNHGNLNEAREDYQKALALAQESGDEDLIATVQRSLGQLDNDQAP